jgi:hypothetical protein
MEIEESQKYENSLKVIKKTTKEDVEEDNSLELGTEYTVIPEPKNKEEAFIRLKKLIAQRIFESHLRHFKTKYGNAVNIKIIKDELKDIEDFILKANNLSTAETFNNKNISDLHEYSRLLNNYYKNPQKEYYDYYSFFRGNCASVYAKYFLYKQWLEQKNIELEKEVLSNQIIENENIVVDNNQFPVIEKSENLELQKDTKQKIEMLSGLITHENSSKIVDFIKVKYKNIQGKRLKLLLMALQELKLLPKERVAQKFHNCCKSEFNWKIASYNAMNGYSYNNNLDAIELNEMSERIKSIL